MSFAYMVEEIVKKILVIVSRLELEYKVFLRSYSTTKNINNIERIQTATTKLITTLFELTYQKRLSRKR